MGNDVKCPKCGSVVEEKEKFCRECGIPVQDLTSDYRKKLEEKGGEKSEKNGQDGA